MKTIEELIESRDQFSVNATFVLSCENGDLELVKACLSHPKLSFHADLGSHGSDGLLSAIENGHADIIKYLLFSKDLNYTPTLEIFDLFSYSFHHYKESLETIKLIYKYANETNQNIPYESIFNDACDTDNIDILKFIISKKDFADLVEPAYQEYCLYKAITKNRFNTVHFFLSEDSLNFRINYKYYLNNIINDDTQNVDKSIKNLIEACYLNVKLNQDLTQKDDIQSQTKKIKL